MRAVVFAVLSLCSLAVAAQAVPHPKPPAKKDAKPAGSFTP